MFIVHLAFVALVCVGTAIGADNYDEEVIALSPTSFFRLQETGSEPLAFSNEISGGNVGDGNWDDVTATYALGANSSPDGPILFDSTNRYAKLQTPANPQEHLGTISVTGPMFTYPGFSYGMFVYPAALPSTGKKGELFTTSKFGLDEGNTDYLLHSSLIYATDLGDPTKLLIQCKVTDNNLYAFTATTAPLDISSGKVWWHIMCVLDDSEMLTLYINGVSIQSSPIGSGTAPPNGAESNYDSNLANYTETRIGFIPTQTSILNAYIDEIVTFDTALSGSQVKFLYDVSQNQPPAIDDVSVLTVNENAQYDQTLTVTDDGSSGTWVGSLTATPTIAGFNIVSGTGQVTFTPPFTQVRYDEGSVNVTLEVTYTDEFKATDTRQFIIEVVNVNRAPTLSVDAPASATMSVSEGTVVFISVTGTDPDEDDPVTITEGTPTLPAGATLDATVGSANFTWTAPEVGSDTPFSFQLVATDWGGLQDTIDFTITVENVPEPTTTAAATTAAATTTAEAGTVAATTSAAAAGATTTAAGAAGTTTAGATTTGGPTTTGAAGGTTTAGTTTADETTTSGDEESTTTADDGGETSAPTSGAGTTTSGASTAFIGNEETPVLETWHIAVLAVAGLLALIVCIVVVVVCTNKRRAGGADDGTEMKSTPGGGAAAAASVDEGKLKVEWIEDDDGEDSPVE